MKSKKMFLFTAILPLLAACTPESIAGTYGFQMGKETGTHFGIFLTLTDKPYEEDAQFKDFNLTLSMKFPDGNSEATSEAVFGILDYFTNENGEVSIPGYYQVTEELDKQKANILKIGISLNYVKEKIRDIYKDQTGKDVDETSLDELSDLADIDLVQAAFYATYKGSTLNFYIPVSFEDVYYQLYWYGYDVQISIPELFSEGDDSIDSGLEPTSAYHLMAEDEEEDESTPGIVIVETTQHQLGTHPTKEEVEEINKTFIETHKDLYFKTYRDFNNLEMGLLKK